MPNRALALRPLIIAGALAASIVLAACSTPAPSGGTGGDGGSGGSDGTNGRPSSSQDDSGTSGTDDSDTGTEGQPQSGRLPAGWPDDVVVPEGEIVQSVGMGGTWLALIDVADTAAAFASSSASLQAAGYLVVSEFATDHGSIGVYENDERQVQVAVATSADAGWTMSYTITEKG